MTDPRRATTVTAANFDEMPPTLKERVAALTGQTIELAYEDAGWIILVTTAGEVLAIQWSAVKP